MRDNKTSQPAQEYESNVAKTMPLYRLFHEQTLDLVETFCPQPQNWLDSGCGTGSLVGKAAKRFGNTQFTLADPSDAMLEIAQFNLSDEQARCTYVSAGTEEMSNPASYEVITAILSHHYVVPEVRRHITKNCYTMLRPGGVYVTFESIRPLTQTGLTLGLERWRQAQLQAGKSPDAVTKHISRYGVEFLPISIADHLEVLASSGFTTVELFWASYLQAGFYAIK